MCWYRAQLQIAKDDAERYQALADKAKFDIRNYELNIDFLEKQLRRAT